MTGSSAQSTDMFLRLLQPGSLLSNIVAGRLRRFIFHNPPPDFKVEKGWRWLFNPLPDARVRGLLKYYQYWRLSKVNDQFYYTVALQFGRTEVHTITFNRRDATAEERAQLDESMRVAHAYYESDPAFQVAINRLNDIGISSEFKMYQEDQGAYNAVGLYGSVKSLERLERLAADDAGYRSADERLAAAKRFRIFLFRNYAGDYKRYRERYADVGGSPYDDPSNWPERT